MENFYKELQQQKELLITDIKKVCNQLCEKYGNPLDDLSISIYAMNNEVNIYRINVDEDNLLIVSDFYDCCIEDLNFEQLYSLNIQLKELL